jgi:hypothetical protein
VPEASAEQLRRELLAATEFLQRIGASRDMLTVLSPAEKIDLINAAGDVFCADPEERRIRTKALKRQRRSAKVQRDETVLAETGIRALREQTVFTTPNVYAPHGFVQRDVDEATDRETVEPQHCYVCKVKYHEVHHFYDQLCPACAEFNFAKRGELTDLTGMVALLTGGRV